MISGVCSDPVMSDAKAQKGHSVRGIFRLTPLKIQSSNWSKFQSASPKGLHWSTLASGTSVSPKCEFMIIHDIHVCRYGSILRWGGNGLKRPIPQHENTQWNKQTSFASARLHTFTINFLSSTWRDIPLRRILCITALTAFSWLKNCCSN